MTENRLSPDFHAGLPDEEAPFPLPDRELIESARNLAGQGSELLHCANCQALIESFEISCHGCGRIVSAKDESLAPVVLPVADNGEQPSPAAVPSFRELRGRAPVKTLFCGNCHRPLLEAEVYAYRRSQSGKFRCLCGFEGLPLAYGDESAFARDRAEAARQRAILIQAAACNFKSGKQKNVAAWLAILTGFCGGHRFYLGERMNGYLYAFFFWTGIPLLVSFLDAAQIIGMTRVDFNLTYNLDCVLAAMPAENFGRTEHLMEWQSKEDLGEAE